VSAVAVEAIPALDALGRDLLATTPWQRRLALARPFVLVLVFALAAWADLLWLEPAIVFLIFVAVVTVTHDVVHDSLGLGRQASEWALFFLGAVLLESGHAYRASHLRHHRVFPGPDDPEGDPARLTAWGAVFQGPVFLPRLWLWAFRRRAQVGWLLAEAAGAALVCAFALGAAPWTRVPLLYVGLVVPGSWVYPLLTVHLPHRGYGATPLTQTRTLRGRVIPALFLELTYHLEHHLYPQVPSHNLARLSRRLDPVLTRAGVVPYRVP
jgi:beta-carotene hydroxylase